MRSVVLEIVSLDLKLGGRSGCWMIVGLSEREHLIIYRGGSVSTGVVLRPPWPIAGLRLHDFSPTEIRYFSVLVLHEIVQLIRQTLRASG